MEMKGGEPKTLNYFAIFGCLGGADPGQHAATHFQALPEQHKLSWKCYLCDTLNHPVSEDRTHPAIANAPQHFW